MECYYNSKPKERDYMHQMWELWMTRRPTSALTNKQSWIEGSYSHIWKDIKLKDYSHGLGTPQLMEKVRRHRQELKNEMILQCYSCSIHWTEDTTTTYTQSSGVTPSANFTDVNIALLNIAKHHYHWNQGDCICHINSNPGNAWVQDQDQEFECVPPWIWRLKAKFREALRDISLPTEVQKVHEMMVMDDEGVQLYVHKWGPEDC